jgi:hypothetical protein
VAFPVVEATNKSANTTAGTSHVVSLPTGIVAGHLLIALVASGGTNAQQFDVSGVGWSELVDENATFGMHVFYRWADGSEGSTVTFTCTGSSRTAHITYRISGAVNPATQVPQISAVSVGAASNNPNPNTVTPTGGAKDYLWITFFANGGTEEADDNTWANNAATNYGNLLQSTSGTGGTNVGAVLASSHRTNNAASEDAVWPVGSTDISATWRAFTLAVHPAPPAPSAGAASGAIGWAGSATGTRTPKGAATGTVAWAGSATGTRIPKGAASGTVAWVGSATGETPLDPPLEGAATGAISWAGSATGTTVHSGSASGTVAWAGEASGTTARSGNASGTIAWAGTATGTVPGVVEEESGDTNVADEVRILPVNERRTFRVLAENRTMEVPAP